MADNDSRSGRRYSDDAITDYVQRIHGAHDHGLDLAFRAPERADIPAIQLGQEEGRLLELLLRLVDARRAVEIGTLAGYSAIRAARAMGDRGKLWTLELLPAHAEIARKNIEAAGASGVIEVLVGPALDLLPGLTAHGPFDAVFLDADKESYDQYGRWALANLRPGGLLIGDNAYLFGHLMEDTPTARAMRRFHEETAAACHSVCVPTPDGMVVGIKR